MNSAIASFVAGFPGFLAHAGVALAILAAGVIAHIVLTPTRELSLVRRGNAAAGVSLGGVLVEAFQGVAFRLAPLAFDEALALVDDARGAILLDGFRNGPVYDKVAIAQALVEALNKAGFHVKVKQ